jgi:hypothetical protein
MSELPIETSQSAVPICPGTQIAADPTVTALWDDPFPVTEAEIRVVETYLSDLTDAILALTRH